MQVCRSELSLCEDFHKWKRTHVTSAFCFQLWVEMQNAECADNNNVGSMPCHYPYVNVNAPTTQVVSCARNVKMTNAMNR